jgi:molecular chaperone Hsp33
MFFYSVASKICFQANHLFILMLFVKIIMMKKDYIVTALAYQGKLRLLAARTTDLTQEGCKRHQTLPTASAALGRTLTAGALFASTLKGEEKYTIRIAGNGPLGEIVVDANAFGQVRGYVHNGQVHFPVNGKGKLDVGRAVGEKGMVAVVKSFGPQHQFTGQTPIISGEIAEDLNAYLVNSEQIPSALALGVLVNPDGTIAASGGYLVQAMPGCDDETLKKVEATIYRLPAISNLLSSGLTPEEILSKIIPDNGLEILQQKPLQFKCSCSRQRTEATLMLLGKNELEDMVKTQHGADAHCNFCNEHYHFSEQNLLDLIQKLTHPQH